MPLIYRPRKRSRGLRWDGGAVLWDGGSAHCQFSLTNF